MRLIASALIAACLFGATAGSQLLSLGDADARPAANGAETVRAYSRLSRREIGDDRVVDGRSYFIIVRRPWVQDDGFCTSQIVREQFIQIGLDARRMFRTTSAEYVHIPMAREECERRSAEFDVSSASTSPFGQPENELRCSHLYARICVETLDQAKRIAEQHRDSNWRDAFFTNGFGYTRWTPGASDREQAAFDRTFDELFSRESLPRVTIETRSGRFTRIDCSRFDWPDCGALICRVGDSLYVELTQPPVE